MTPKTHNTIDEYANSGIYKVTRATRKCSDVGQTRCNLKQRYQEQDI